MSAVPTDRRLRFAALGVAAHGHAIDGEVESKAELCRVAAPVADLCAAPNGARDRQMRYGDMVELLLHQEGFGFARRVSDGYVGWVPLAALAPLVEAGEPYMVAARQTFAFSEPNIKSRERIALSLGSTVDVKAWHGDLAETEAGFVPRQHLVKDAIPDPVSVAETLLGTPYLWGGDSGFGIDCSGLVALCYHMAGVTIPGDSDLQSQHAGETLSLDTPHQHGDLWFWRGHVAMIRDQDTLIHANAFHMSVSIEPIEATVARIATGEYGEIVAKHRINY